MNKNVFWRNHTGFMPLDSARFPYDLHKIHTAPKIQVISYITICNRCWFPKRPDLLNATDSESIFISGTILALQQGGELRDERK